MTIPCSVHLISLVPSSSARNFLDALAAGISSKEVIIKARPQGFIIKPKSLHKSQILPPKWDVFLMLSTNSFNPTTADATKPHVAAHYSMPINLQKSQCQVLREHNEKWLHPAPGSGEVPKLPEVWNSNRVPSESIEADKTDVEKQQKTGEIPLDKELADYFENFGDGDETVAKGPIGILYFLAYEPEGGKERYSNFVKGYSNFIGTETLNLKLKFGGDICGPSTFESGGNQAASMDEATAAQGQTKTGWDELAYVQYPTIGHLAYMLGMDEYKEYEKWKVGSLADYGIMCVSELAL